MTHSQLGPLTLLPNQGWEVSLRPTLGPTAYLWTGDPSPRQTPCHSTAKKGGIGQSWYSHGSQRLRLWVQHPARDKVECVIWSETCRPCACLGSHE